MNFEAIFQRAGNTEIRQGLEIEGQIPQELSGTLYRVGVGQFYTRSKANGHWFDGEGGIVKITLSNGEAQGHYRLLDIPGSEDESLGRFGKAPRSAWDRIRGLWTPETYLNSANTALMMWQNRLFALYEGAFPTEVHPETLEFMGVEDFGGVVKRAFTAHPKYNRAKESWLAFGFRILPRPCLDLYELPKLGPARHLGAVPYNGSSFVHDFALTENYALFVISPVFANPVDLLFKGKPLSQSLYFDTKRATELLVVPLADTKAVKKFTLPACLFTHTAFAREPSVGELELVGTAYADGSNLDWIQSRWPIGSKKVPSSPGQLWNWNLDLQRGNLSSERIFDASIEVPTASSDARFVYAAGFKEARESADGFYNSLYRFDMLSKQTQMFYTDKNEIVSELILAGNYGLSLHFNAERQASCLCVFKLDQQVPELIGRAWFRQALPFTFHGFFTGPT